MASTNKAKAAGVSASSFLDLKAELARHESEFARKREKGGKTSPVRVGGLDGGKGKKKSTWAHVNRGVAERNARDLAVEEMAANARTADAVRAALERKARIYDKLRRGRSGGLTEREYDALLVDFDAKQEEDHFESDSEDVDESLTVPKPPVDEDDPIVEYEDEFGRIRTAHRSEIPRNQLPSTVDGGPEEEDNDPYVVYNPVNYFPVYEPSSERREALEKAAAEAAREPTSHYDASRENRAKGAAFYAFSADEEARAKEMAELRTAREETTRVRTEMGAVDVLPGEVEGMVDEGLPGPSGASGKELANEAVLGARSRAMEKRKRGLEERKKLIEAKRMKVAGGKVQGAESAAKDAVTQVSSSTSAGMQAPSEDAMSPANKGRPGWNDIDKASTREISFTSNAADEFLAQLEEDLIEKK